MTDSLESSTECPQITRRDLAKVAIGSLMGGMLVARPLPGVSEVRPNPPGLKLAVNGSANPTDDDLLFLRELGVEYVFCGVTPELNSVEGLQQIKKRYAQAGVTVHNVRNMPVMNELMEVAPIASYHAVDVLQTGLADERGEKVRDFDLASPTQGLFGT